MKSPIIAAILLVLAAPAAARMRHDRMCDRVQDKFEIFNPAYNPQHAHGVRFGRCEHMVFDDNPDYTTSLAATWGSLSCGYQAYREGKKLTAKSYKTPELTAQWQTGWKIARQSCTTGNLPDFNYDEAK
jgi:ribosome modulation factor